MAATSHMTTETMHTTTCFLVWRKLNRCVSITTHEVESSYLSESFHINLITLLVMTLTSTPAFDSHVLKAEFESHKLCRRSEKDLQLCECDIDSWVAFWTGYMQTPNRAVLDLIKSRHMIVQIHL